MSELSDNLPNEIRKRIDQRVTEVRKLYDVSEAEMTLITQLATVSRLVLQVSPKLFTRLLTVYSSINEVIYEETKVLHVEEEQDT